jgi:hypothetical protein
MEIKTLDWNRRRTILAAVGSVCTGLAIKAEAQQKMSLAQAQYQGSPNGIYSCGNCSLFEPPHSCKVVVGEVTEDGWCKAYTPVD